MTIVHGVRWPATSSTGEELEQAARTDPAFSYVPIVSRESDRARWSGLTGTCSRRSRGARSRRHACHVFCAATRR